jgi:hypothetical protein
MNASSASSDYSTLRAAALVVIVASVLMSCGNNTSLLENASLLQGQNVIVRELPADSDDKGEFTYFRLSDSSIVTGRDIATPRWDIAFRSTTIWINGGTNRPGRGGAQVLRNQDYNALVEAPSTGYQVDESSTTLAIPSGSGNGWYTYNALAATITPIANTVIALRTGEGKYAKLQILSYYRGAPTTPTITSTPRYYTFRYFYQPNGSRTLQ